MAHRVYEIMYIALPETANEDIAKLNEGIQTLVEADGGSVVRIDDIGRRKLAYEIKRKKEGYYVLLEIACSGKEIAELERRFRVNDAIIRFISVRVDEERKTADKIRNKREAKFARRHGVSKADESVDNSSTEVQENQ